MFTLPTVSWLILLGVVFVIGATTGWSVHGGKLPKRIQHLLENVTVMDVIRKGVDIAETMKQLNDEQKREYVRAWGKSELYSLLGEWLPDSVVNYLIEHTIMRIKFAPPKPEPEKEPALV